MAKQELSIDPQVFVKTASLFANKREVLPAEAVRRLANDIVQRLAQSAYKVADEEIPPVRPENISAFCDTLVGNDPEAALLFIDQRRAEGLTRDGVYAGYIGAAARELGHRWDQDQASFMDVTVGTGRLYALMRAMRAEGSFGRPAPDARRKALFATVPGEDHGLGITMAADIFREAGWQIDLQTATDHDDLLTHIETTTPGVIGLSLSTEHRLEQLMRLVVAIRIAMPETILGVAPGASLDADRLKRLVDIDLVFTDVTAARNSLDQKLGLGGLSV